ncbi:hypothetical protein BDV93DRAFT_563890 [Ceratobasidium sp. AG-I]|nr:hypothetical protein BDV93DRAFT_563890 [Ceratobasidium sp. AG-I]
MHCQGTLELIGFRNIQKLAGDVRLVLPVTRNRYSPTCSVLSMWSRFAQDGDESRFLPGGRERRRIEYRAGLRFRKGVNTTRHLEKLHQAAAHPPYNFKVYTGTIDSVTTHRETDPWYAKGDHSYDNKHPLMLAMFIAGGPFTDRVRTQVFTCAQPPNIPTNRFTRPTPATTYVNATTKAPIYVPPRGGGGGKNGPVLIEHF